MNIPTFLKPSPYDGDAFRVPLDLDPGFEEACRQSLQEPMQTPTERLREAQENILIVLRDKDEAHAKRIFELEQALAEERGHKAANLEEIANVERSHAALNDPHPVSPSSSKREKGAAA
jgi:hypothetical protein